MDDYYNKHYITVDENSYIIGGFSDAFKQPQDGDMLINDKGGYQFRFVFESGLSEENPNIRDMCGVPLYCWNGKYAIKRPDEDVEADRPEIKPVAGQLSDGEIGFLKGMYAGTGGAV